MKDYYKSILLFYKKTFETFFILFLVLTFLTFLISCSGVSTSKLSDSYLSPKYEDKSFKDVSMDICYINSKYEYNDGPDSNITSSLINFDTTFKKYFADGIKMFSSVNKTGWIFYDDDFYNNNYIDYMAKTKDGKDFFVTLTDSLSIFQNKSNSDFLFIVHYIYLMQNGPMQSNKNTVGRKDYESVICIDYSIWDTKYSEIVAKDNVTTSLKFKNFAGKWPFRGVALKAASEIFDKLPMFSK